MHKLFHCTYRVDVFRAEVGISCRVRNLAFVRVVIYQTICAIYSIIAEEVCGVCLGPRRVAGKHLEKQGVISMSIVVVHSYLVVLMGTICIPLIFSGDTNLRGGGGGGVMVVVVCVWGGGGGEGE